MTARTAVALIAVAMAAMATAAQAMPRNVKLGEALVPLKLTDIDGNSVDTSTWRGSPGVWLFVAADQTSSEKAARDLQAAIDDLTGADIRAVELTSDAVKIDYFKELRARYNIRIPFAIDPGREVYGRIGVIVLPTTLIIDKDGKLAAVTSGYDLAYGRTIRARLARLAGRITADEEARLLSTSQPARDEKRDRAERLCRSAEIMQRRGLRGEAIQELQKAIAADPQFSAAYLQLARLKMADGDLAEAEKLVDAVRRQDAANRQAQLELGTIRFLQGKLDDAEKLLNEALVLNPDPARTRYWLGRVFLARNQPDKAAAHFRAAVEQAIPDLAIKPEPKK